MAKKYFLPRNDADRQLWLQNFSNKLAGYTTKYSIANADLLDMTASNTAFIYWLNYINQYREYLHKLVQYKNDLSNNKSASSVEPVPPTMPVAPAVVPTGLFGRASAIALRIKSHNDYTEADGNDLGIEGEEANQEDENNAKPAIQLRLIKGGNPQILWTRGSMEGIDIYVDRGNGQWTFLATDTVPNYTDNMALPAAGQSAVWKYRCIYRMDDAQAGQWSDEVSIAVSGVV